MSNFIAGAGVLLFGVIFGAVIVQSTINRILDSDKD